jgi:hypothetical protein
VEIVSEFWALTSREVSDLDPSPLGGKGLRAVVEENLMEIPVFMIPNHAPATIFISI